MNHFFSLADRQRTHTKESMMKATLFRSLTAACAFAMIAATAHAQEDQNTPREQSSGQQADAQPGQQPSAQPDQQSAQPDQQPRSEQPDAAGQQTDADKRYEARRVSPTAASGAGQASVQDYLVTKLTLANTAEIQMGQLATEKAQNPEVKQFAQMLIRDHQQLNEQLQKLGSEGQSTERSSQTTRAQGQEQRREATTERRADRSERREARAERTEIRRDTEESGDRARGLRRSGASQQVPQQLTQLTQQAAQKHLQMAKQMLQEKQGQEFDAAFVGMQIAGHTWLLAELQAMQDAGSSEFQQVARQAEQKTAEHLQHAQQLASKIMSDRGTVSQGAESTKQGQGTTEESSRRGESEQNRRSN